MNNLSLRHYVVDSQVHYVDLSEIVLFVKASIIERSAGTLKLSQLFFIA